MKLLWPFWWIIIILMISFSKKKLIKILVKLKLWIFSLFPFHFYHIFFNAMKKNRKYKIFFLHWIGWKNKFVWCEHKSCVCYIKYVWMIKWFSHMSNNNFFILFFHMSFFLVDLECNDDAYSLNLIRMKKNIRKSHKVSRI